MADNSATTLGTYQQKLEAFTNAYKEKRDLEARLAAVKATIDANEEWLLEAFADMGQSSVKVDGGTVYISSQLWAGVATDSDGNRMPRVTVEALERSGHSEFVTVNHQSLSAFVRELPKDEMGNPVFPPELEGTISYRIERSLRFRKGSTKE